MIKSKTLQRELIELSKEYTVEFGGKYLDKISFLHSTAPQLWQEFNSVTPRLHRGLFTFNHSMIIKRAYF